MRARWAEARVRRVPHLGIQRVVEQDVLGLEVAVDDALGVKVHDTVGNLLQNAQQLAILQLELRKRVSATACAAKKEAPHALFL